MRQLLNYGLIGTMVVLSSFLAVAQQDVEGPISNELWEDVIDNADYTETFLEREKNKVENKDANSDFSSLLNYDWSSFKYLFYLILIGLLIYLLVKIMLNAKQNPTISSSDLNINSIEEIEERMLEIDLDKLLKEALAAENYRIAFRINFLIIIKMLNQAGYIVWAKEKTNWEYHAEVKKQRNSAEI